MKLKFIMVSALALTVSGCISVKSYVDPKYSDISYESVNLEPDTAFNVSTEFLQNGKSKKAGKKHLDKTIAKVFEKAGITNSADAGASLKITCENIADMKEAAGKGVGTGLTLGLAGSTVTDGYNFTFELTENGNKTLKTYNHALHSTIGNADAPIAGVEGVTPLAGFEAVFEDVLLKFVQDMNSTGDIAFNEITLSYFGASYAP